MINTPNNTQNTTSDDQKVAGDELQVAPDQSQTASGEPIQNVAKNIVTNKRYSGLKPNYEGRTTNPKGRGKGVLDYKTVYWNAIKSLAKAEGINAKQYHQEILKTGAKMAKKGDFRFYKDTLDRNYGQATMIQEVAHTGDLNITSFRDNKVIEGQVISNELPAGKDIINRLPSS